MDEKITCKTCLNYEELTNKHFHKYEYEKGTSNPDEMSENFCCKHTQTIHTDTIAKKCYEDERMRSLKHNLEYRNNLLKGFKKVFKYVDVLLPVKMEFEQTKDVMEKFHSALLKECNERTRIIAKIKKELKEYTEKLWKKND